MPTLTLTLDQVIDLVKQLPPERKIAVLDALSQDRNQWWEKMRAEGDQQMRRLCSERGLEWDRLTDEERISLVDDLIHEDRRCSP